MVVQPRLRGVVPPDAATVQQRFFEELATLMEQVATHQVPLGDFNIHLDRSDNAHAPKNQIDKINIRSVPVLSSTVSIVFRRCPTKSLRYAGPVIISSVSCVR